MSGYITAYEARKNMENYHMVEPIVKTICERIRCSSNIGGSKVTIKWNRDINLPLTREIYSEVKLFLEDRLGFNVVWHIGEDMVISWEEEEWMEVRLDK